MSPKPMKLPPVKVLRLKKGSSGAKAQNPCMVVMSSVLGKFWFPYYYAGSPVGCAWLLVAERPCQRASKCRFLEKDGT